MMRIRTIEETIAARYPEGEMRTPTHFSIGQEATAVGVCAALKTEDAVYSGHRCHAHYLAKGGNLLGMVAELFGREAGCARGRGGSVHLNDPGVGMIASSAIMGETIATAVGTAFAFAMDNRPHVSVTFFGDGCVEEGIFHESMNFAVMRKLPVLFVCENNLFSVHSPLYLRQPRDIPIYARAQSYGMLAQQVDGNNVEAVYEAAVKGINDIRKKGGPFFLECMTYRWREHVGPLFDTGQGYRTQKEIDHWMARCPIKQASETALSRGACTPDQIKLWKNEYQTEVEKTIQSVVGLPFPDTKGLLEGTYS
ncbi:MAG: thiamine pyrophosphate-dependent dehydrogenase E1 component subunit alpha [Deltaproteobacteria bacterium]|nr:thiamine pyrophosphate-dependent dehydrogenase E1 component subunit alpha [Deltaproteobacteria bacterium]